MENEIVAKIKEVSEKAVGCETYGSVTEFYDEDGAVLMTAEEKNNGQVLFKFSDSEFDF